MITISSIEYILIIILPILYQLCGFGIISMNIVYVVLLFTALIGLYKNNFCIYIENGFKGIFISIIFTYLGCSIVSGNVSFGTICYIGLIIAFYFIIVIIGNEISDSLENYIIGLFWSSSILLIPNIFLYVNDISISVIQKALLVEKDIVRERMYMGFIHPNTAAIAMLCEILLVIVMQNFNIQKKIKVISVIFALIAFLGLLATGSRTAVYTLMVFFAVYVVSRQIEKFPQYRKLLYLTIFIIVFSYVGSGTLIGVVMQNSSGRDQNYLLALNALESKGKFLFGIGVRSIAGSVGETISEVIGQNVIIDGWYIYMLICTGISGLIIIIIGVINTLYTFIKNACSRFKPLVISLGVLLLLYGVTENVVFVPGVELSLIVWIVLYSLVSNSSRRLLEDKE